MCPSDDFECRLTSIGTAWLRHVGSEITRDDGKKEKAKNKFVTIAGLQVSTVLHHRAFLWNSGTFGVIKAADTVS
jgi:hypothetical protein